MIDPKVAEELMPFFTNEERRTKAKQVLPNEVEKETLSKAVNKGILIKLTSTKGAPKKGQRASGYRFSDLGRSFMLFQVQNEKKDEQIRLLKERIEELESKAAPELDDAVKRTGAEMVVEAVKAIQRPVWIHLITIVDDPQLSTALRRIVIAMSQYARAGVA